MVVDASSAFEQLNWKTASGTGSAKSARQTLRQAYCWSLARHFGKAPDGAAELQTLNVFGPVRFETLRGEETPAEPSPCHTGARLRQAVPIENLTLHNSVGHASPTVLKKYTVPSQALGRRQRAGGVLAKPLPHTQRKGACRHAALRRREAREASTITTQRREQILVYNMCRSYL